MCFNVSLHASTSEIESHFKKMVKVIYSHSSKYFVNGFSFPKLGIITNEHPNLLQGYNWGLIPKWAKDEVSAKELRKMTLNAVSETVFTKPSFRDSIISKRCLIPVTGFFEWQHIGSKKIPFFIHLKRDNIFCLAGIWSEWANKITGEIIPTFSILTTTANPLLAEIHNTKKRMPLIMPKEQQWEWLSNDLRKDDIIELMKPYPETEIEAYTIKSETIRQSKFPENS